MIKKLKPLKILIFLILLKSFVSCTESFKNEENSIKIINKHLKIKLPNEVSSFNSANNCLDQSFNKPCIFFCSFLISKDNFTKWIEQIDVPVVDAPFLNNFCNNDQQILNKVTNINLHDFANTKKYTWWNPTKCKLLSLYASFYSSQSKTLIRVFEDSWDGRVLIAYCEEKSYCYVIIETFL